MSHNLLCDKRRRRRVVGGGFQLEHRLDVLLARHRRRATTTTRHSRLADALQPRGLGEEAEHLYLLRPEALLATVPLRKRSEHGGRHSRAIPVLVLPPLGRSGEPRLLRNGR